jgi:hypothetical protein
VQEQDADLATGKAETFGLGGRLSGGGHGAVSSLMKTG